MIRLAFLFLFLGFTATTLGQNVQNYSYIKVPVKFEFLKQENQYQLNALTAFLFEKKGYEVLYGDNIPAGTDPCDVLQAKVHNDSGLFRSRLYFTLEDCKGETVFKSKTGVSREKDFKTSYQEALRNTFGSLEESGSVKSDTAIAIVIDPVTTSQEIDSLRDQPEEIIIDPVVTASEIDSVNPELEPSGENELTGDSTSKGGKYINGSLVYILRNNSSGYELFKEKSNTKFATLLKSGSGSNYIYASENISGNAFFDTSGNLVVEYLDPGSQQLISVVYKALDQ